jgi:AbiEi antitoxin C-terminal domain
LTAVPETDSLLLSLPEGAANFKCQPDRGASCGRGWKILMASFAMGAVIRGNIDDRMRYEARPDYVGLRTPAAIHGASHQAVMEFQVVTDTKMHTEGTGTFRHCQPVSRRTAK